MAARVLIPDPPSESGTLVHGLQRQMQLTESPVGFFLDLFLTTEACFLPQRLILWIQLWLEHGCF